MCPHPNSFVLMNMDFQIILTKGRVWPLCYDLRVMYAMIVRLMKTALGCHLLPRHCDFEGQSMMTPVVGEAKINWLGIPRITELLFGRAWAKKLSYGCHSDRCCGWYG